MTWQDNPLQLKKDWDENGYAVVRNFMSVEEVGELRAEIERYIAEIVPEVPEYEVMYEDKAKPETLKRLGHMSKYDDYFANLVQTGRFVELAGTLLGGEVIPQYCQLFNKPARVGIQTPPHQDAYYIPLEPNEALTMWLALNDVDEENGCLRYVPGAHRKGIRPHQASNVFGFSQGISDFGEAERATEVACPAAVGDVVIHHWSMVHRADPNPSDRERWGLGSVFYRADAKTDEERQEARTRELEKTREKWEAQGKSGR